MIFQQTILNYLLSFIVASGLAFRLYRNFNIDFSSKVAATITALFILHPLNLESLLGPNFINGALAFWLLLEGINSSKEFQKSNNEVWRAMLFFSLAGMLNIHYILIPIYFGYKLLKAHYWKMIFLIPYSLMAVCFLYFNFSGAEYNPLKYFTLFVVNIFAPLQTNFFHYGLFSVNHYLYIFSFAIFILFIINKMKGQQKDEVVITLLICLTMSFRNFNFRTDFWTHLMGNTASYMFLTYVFCNFILHFLKEKIYIALGCFWLYLTFINVANFFPTSKYIESSFQQLPEEFSKFKDAQKVMAWQFLYEEKKTEGEKIIRQLILDNPNDQELKDQLDAIPQN